MAMLRRTSTVGAPEEFGGGGRRLTGFMRYFGITGGVEEPFQPADSPKSVTSIGETCALASSVSRYKRE